MTLWRKTFHGTPSGGEGVPSVSGTQRALDLTPLWRQERLCDSSVILEANASDTLTHRLVRGVRASVSSLSSIASAREGGFETRAGQ
jgi:hypothetical protein